jgi:hypothetical protein
VTLGYFGKTASLTAITTGITVKGLVREQAIATTAATSLGEEDGLCRITDAVR